MQTRPWMATALAALVGGCFATTDDTPDPADPGVDDQASPADAAPYDLIPERLYGRQLECQTGFECDDGNPCTVDTCISNSCRWAPRTGTCDDGDACTIGDRCVESSCRGEAKLLLLDASPFEEQPWRIYGESSSMTQEGDSLVVETVEDRWSMAYRAIDGGDLVRHDLEFTARVDSAAQFESGGAATFFMSYDVESHGSKAERAQALLLGPETMAWGDFSEVTEIAGHEPHVYRLHITEDGARAAIYVDGVSRLVRTDATFDLGIAFGDASAEHGAEGHYIIGDVGFVPRVDVCEPLP